MNNIAIVTAVIGNRDILRNPEITYPNVDYYAIVSDNAVIPSNTKWNIIKSINFSRSNKKFLNRRQARFAKAVPDYYLPREYQYIFWRDANFEIICDPIEIIEKKMNDVDFVSYKHPERNCVYQEIEAVKRFQLDYPFILNNQKEFYETIGYPKNNGLVMSAVIFRRMTNQIKEFNLFWWEQICRFSSRDQLSINYCLDVLHIKRSILEDNVYNNKYCKRRKEHDGITIRV